MNENLKKPRIKRGWVSYEVIKVVKENPNVVHAYLIDHEDRNVPFDYQAGQYLTMKFDQFGPRPLVRSYTMSSSPQQQDSICLSVKRVENGVVSTWFCDDLKEGTILKARGPIGKFCFDPSKDKDLFLVAAGSGVTPFVSMAREYAGRLGSKDAPGSIHLLLGFQTPDDRVCGEDIDLLTNAHPNLKIHITYSRKEVDGFMHGRISHKMIDDIVGDQFGAFTFMTCGPVPMMDMVVDHLKSKGVEEEHIKLESFV